MQWPLLSHGPRNRRKRYERRERDRLRPCARLHNNPYYGIFSAAIVVGPYSSGKVLIATSRPSFVSLARHTSPIPPLPKSVEIS